MDFSVLLMPWSSYLTYVCLECLNVLFEMLKHVMWLETRSIITPRYWHASHPTFICWTSMRGCLSVCGLGLHNMSQNAHRHAAHAIGLIKKNDTHTHTHTHTHNNPYKARTAIEKMQAQQRAYNTVLNWGNKTLSAYYCNYWHLGQIVKQQFSNKNLCQK